jgi:hypothetical protein
MQSLLVSIQMLKCVCFIVYKMFSFDLKFEHTIKHQTIKHNVSIVGFLYKFVIVLEFNKTVSLDSLFNILNYRF